MHSRNDLYCWSNGRHYSCQSIYCLLNCRHFCDKRSLFRCSLECRYFFFAVCLCIVFKLCTAQFLNVVNAWHHFCTVAIRHHIYGHIFSFFCSHLSSTGTSQHSFRVMRMSRVLEFGYSQRGSLVYRFELVLHLPYLPYYVIYISNFNTYLYNIKLYDAVFYEDKHVVGIGSQRISSYIESKYSSDAHLFSGITSALRCVEYVYLIAIRLLYHVSRLKAMCSVALFILSSRLKMSIIYLSCFAYCAVGNNPCSNKLILSSSFTARFMLHAYFNAFVFIARTFSACCLLYNFFTVCQREIILRCTFLGLSLLLRLIAPNCKLEVDVCRSRTHANLKYFAWWRDSYS